MKKLEGLREIFKNAKHRRATPIFCPCCASPKIQLNSSLDLWLTPRQYHCENCGYTGILVMELEKDNQQTEAEQNLESEDDSEKQK